MSLVNYENLYIGGRWQPPSSAQQITARSACTEEELGTVPLCTPDDIDTAVAAAREPFKTPKGWPQWPAADRAAAMTRLAEALSSRGPEMARRVSMQNGMPISTSGLTEASFPSVLLHYYAGLANSLDVEERRPALFGGTSLVVREPVGVVAAIVPWNAPQAITFMKIAPALAAGCTVVLKPSPETVLDAFLMAEAAAEAGLPAGVLNVVTGGREIGEYLVTHPNVDKVSFTGSCAAGRIIGEQCGRLLRPVTLELGGKSAAVVLDDADLQTNIKRFLSATLVNNGQICWLGTRVLAPRKRLPEVVDLVTAMVEDLSVGDPLDAQTQVGPLVSEVQRNRVESLIAQGKADGGTISTGGGRPSDIDRGWFVQPTVFTNVTNADTIAREEIFGPVLCVIPYTDDDEAVAIANDSPYGLGGSVWTADPERGEQLARRIQTGTVGINGYLMDPAAPFGGVKASGLGRELGPEALHAYQTVRSIYLDRDSA